MTQIHRQYCHTCNEYQDSELKSKKSRMFFYKHWEHGRFSAVMLDGKDTAFQTRVHGVPYTEDSKK